MTRKDLVSIIVPVYNVEEYLERCLTSLVKQTYKNIEIICVNDGSTDNSLNILYNYSKKYDNMIIIDKKNGGSASARNVGIRKSHGDYLMFVDSDDYLDINTIDKMYEVMIKNTADIVRCNRHDVHSATNHITSVSPLFNKITIIDKKDYCNKVYIEFFKRGKMSSMCMTLVNSKLIKDNKIYFDESLYVDEDTIYSMKLFDNSNRFVYIPYAYYYYVRHNSGLSGSGIHCKKRYESRIIHINYNIHYFSKWNCIGNQILINSKSALALYTAFQMGKYSKYDSIQERYFYFKKILDEYRNDIKHTDKSNLVIYEKILLFFVKMNFMKIGFVYCIFANKLICFIKKFG